MCDYTFYLSMKNYGGSFVKAMAEAYSRADEHNKVRIKDAFPELVSRYGAGSAFYAFLGYERNLEKSHD